MRALLCAFAAILVSCGDGEGLGLGVAAMRAAKLPPVAVRARALAALDTHAAGIADALAALTGCPEQVDARARVEGLLARCAALCTAPAAVVPS